MNERGTTDLKQANAFRPLLEGFGRAYALVIEAEAAEGEQRQQVLQTFFPGFGEALERWRKEMEDRADDFNLLEVMGLTGKEIRHSMILAWLLDWDMTRLGTHAQGRLGFRLFLSEFGLPTEYADGEYGVWREVSADESRIDIEIVERRKFVIYIENKIWSDEGDDETNREWRDLQRRATALDCPEYHALYLSPGGTKPCNENFRDISWRQVARVLERFASEAKPPDVRLFARHYAKVLTTCIIPERGQEDDDASGQVQ